VVGFKSVSSLAIMGLLPAHISKISEVALFFEGKMLQTERKGIANT
jgi:hypothetical protein